MARALKSARSLRKNKTDIAFQFWNIPPTIIYYLSVEAHCAKRLVSVDQTFMRGDNVTLVTSHYKSKLYVKTKKIVVRRDLRSCTCS